MKNHNYKIWTDSFPFRYEAYPFFTSVYTLSNTPPINKYEVQWKYFANVFHDGQLEGYVPKKEILKNGYGVIKELLKENRSFVEVFDKYHEEIRAAITLCLNYNKDDSKSFKKVWPVIQTTLSNASKILFNFDFALNDYLAKTQSAEHSLFEAISSNIIEDKRSFINEAILRINELMEQYPSNFDKVYNIFISEFGWFQNSYKGVFHISKEWLKDFYLKNKMGESKITKEKLVLNKKYRLLTEVASKGITFRDDKKKLLLIAIPIMDSWLEKVCKDNNLIKSEMLWLTVDEVLKIIESKDKENIENAKNFCLNNFRCGVMLANTYDSFDISFWKKNNGNKFFNKYQRD